MIVPERSSRRRDYWIFAYGSLMWHPGFDVEEVRPATLRGYRRRLCIWSTTYRGTPDRPGLVLGLDRGGSCKGIAFRIDEVRKRPILAYLFERELDDCVYEPRQVALDTTAGRLSALAFVADRDQALYAGDIGLEKTVAAVARGRGSRGTALDYLGGVLRELEPLGIREPKLRRILMLARATT